MAPHSASGCSEGSRVPSVSGQMGQHSPSGMMGSAQSDVSSQITSSHRTWPLSQMQIWHGSGFQTSLSLYNCPSDVQLPNGPEGETELLSGGREQGGSSGAGPPGRCRFTDMQRDVLGQVGTGASHTWNPGESCTTSDQTFYMVTRSE